MTLMVQARHGELSGHAQMVTCHGCVDYPGSKLRARQNAKSRYRKVPHGAITAYPNPDTHRLSPRAWPRSDKRREPEVTREAQARRPTTPWHHFVTWRGRIEDCVDDLCRCRPQTYSDDRGRARTVGFTRGVRDRGHFAGFALPPHPPSERSASMEGSGDAASIV